MATSTLTANQINELVSLTGTPSDMHRIAYLRRIEVLSVNIQRRQKVDKFVPRLANGQRAIVFLETDTGISLSPEDHRYTGTGIYYEIFASEDDALRFVQAYVKEHPKVECSIRDEDGIHIKYISNS